MLTADNNAGQKLLRTVIACGCFPPGKQRQWLRRQREKLENRETRREKGEGGIRRWQTATLTSTEIPRANYRLSHSRITRYWPHTCVYSCIYVHTRERVLGDDALHNNPAMHTRSQAFAAFVRNVGYATANTLITRLRTADEDDAVLFKIQPGRPYTLLFIYYCSYLRVFMQLCADPCAAEFAHLFALRPRRCVCVRVCRTGERWFCGKSEARGATVGWKLDRRFLAG